MPHFTDAELYARGLATALAAWEEYARGATGAALHRSAGVASAVFPCEPERSVYNNAILERGLAEPSARGAALDAMEAAYAALNVDRYAAWVHETDTAMQADLAARGYAVEETTRAMAISLDEIRLPRPEIELAPPDWSEYVRLLGVPSEYLSGADRSAYRVLIARLDGESVGVAMSVDFDGDCGIYNVGTLEHARRRGLGTALTALQLHDALARGCRTASLQATEMAEGVYTAAGFRDLGLILEYVPAD